MKHMKRVFGHFLVMAAATTLYACNLATIDAPLNGQIHPSEPVDIQVLLETGADHTTFLATLNGTPITDRFAYDADLKVMKATLSLADGLLVGPDILNTLITYVGGQSMGFPFTDQDAAGFFVEEGGVATNRDDKGVWYITGPETASLYEISEATGYAVATDRLWQLEQYRRTGRGKLSEILGSSMVSTDIYLRTVHYSDEELIGFFDALDTDSQDMIQGYVDGINRRIRDLRRNPEHIPLEFKLINLNRVLSFDFNTDLKNWTVVDLFGWIIVLQRNFDGNALDQTEVKNAALLKELQLNFSSDAMDMFNDLRWLNDPDALTYIPPSGGGGSSAPMGASVKSASVKDLSTGIAPDIPDLRGVAARMAERSRKVEESLKSINAYVKMGSYGWVVSGAKTASGNPILYSGPQMGWETPSIVTEGCIDAGEMTVSGMTVPGMPTLIISRTPHHALAMMTGHANTEDYYIIEDPDDPLEGVYLHRTETIKVLGGDDVTLPVYRSRRHDVPIVNPMPYEPPTPDNPIISWRYAQWGEELTTTVAALNVMRATDMDEFAVAMEYYPASFHVLYADVDGNIAYWMTGRDPDRPAGEWRFPQGMAGLTDPPLEWDPHVLIPRSTDRNTAQGFYCGWNNKSNPDYDAPYGPFHRAQVLYDYLSANNNLTFDDVRNVALNIATTDSFGGGGNPWKFVETYFTNLVNQPGNDTTARLDALAILAAWDGHFVADGESEWAFGTDRADGWVLMDAWLREVIRLTFEDELGSGQSRDNLFNVLLHGLPGTTINNNYNWFQNLSDPLAPQTADAIILAALDNTLLALGAQPWGLGARGETVYNHAVLASIGAGEVHRMPRSSRSTYAQCVEYGALGPVRIESMFPLGESGMVLGNPVAWSLHPHFLSMISVYDGFAHRPFPLFGALPFP
jgi:penicillin amidase